ncbi:hypothetical protein evm_002151 [Chilo suppressalis]|nr:hypothetical protein evm_002151 [Chilo suppressalis]
MLALYLPNGKRPPRHFQHDVIKKELSGARACSRGGRRAVPAPTVKLAASALSMNPHYHGYAELSSPHPPSPEAAFANGHDYPHNNNNPALKECAGCGGKIVERFLLHALDRYWHHGCLKCTCCGQALADMGRSFYFKGGMILCKSDYTRMFGSGGACAACGQAIPASEFVMRTNAPQQPLHVFHIKCFACSKCGSHLMQGDRYYMLAGSLVCEQDWQKLMKSANAGAGPTAPVRKGKVGRPRRSRE